MFAPIVIALGAALPADSIPAPYISASSTPLVAPAPDERDVPLNTSLWFVLAYQAPPNFEVRLTDAVDGRELALVAEELYRFPVGSAEPTEVGVRWVPQAPLAPERAYRVQWRSSEQGDIDASLFVTGDAEDATPPPRPRIAQAGTCPVYECPSALGVFVQLKQDTLDDVRALVLAEANGVVRGLGRASSVRVLIGEPQVSVVGTVTALDLAGNRSAESEAFSATTAEVDPWVERGCRCAGAGGGAAWWVGALIAVGAGRAARRWRASC